MSAINNSSRKSMDNAEIPNKELMLEATKKLVTLAMTKVRKGKLIEIGKRLTQEVGLIDPDGIFILIADINVEKVGNEVRSKGNLASGLSLEVYQIKEEMMPRILTSVMLARSSDEVSGDLLSEISTLNLDSMVALSKSISEAELEPKGSWFLEEWRRRVGDENNRDIMG
jgi:hypothetical protein